MVDRILLLLLVLLLPLGIVASKIYTGDIQVNSNNTETQKKIEATLNQLAAQINAPKNIETGDFNLTGITLASDSGQLQIGVVAPANNKPLWIHYAGKKKSLKTDSNASASASVFYTPETIVMPPNASSAFSVKIPIKEYIGILEIRLQQDSSTLDVRYDLDKNKQITF